MFKSIRKMSLRTRLALLAGFAIFALLIALFVAWRLARATETFALRQADSAVHSAARDLSRAVQANPDGFLTLEQALPNRGDKSRGQGPRAGDGRRRAIPPHIEKLFNAYAEPLTRLSAITLHRYPEVAGGFYRGDDGTLTGYALSGEPDSSSTKTVPSDLAELVREVASEAVKTESPSSRSVQMGSDRIIVASYPAQEGGLASAWAMRRISHLSGVADWPNAGALLALALSIMAVSGLALLTVRDLRLGVTGIETGLTGLKSDLSSQLPSPDTAELARIAAAINELAATLRTNITRQAELERELRQSERLSALGRVVAGVAHEVRNPLAAIKLKVQLARRGSYPPDKLSETIDVVCAEIERLDSLVRRLLELGGQQRLERSVVNLGELVSRRAAFFNDLATRAGVAIVTSACANNIFFEGDANRLAQVVDNIIQNALDAMPDGGQLTISCNVSRNQGGGNLIRLSFEDTGHGIEPAAQEHLFEPFHTNRAAGTGLGLAIARAIVEEHGGHLDFVSGVDHGASFVIELPAPASSAAPDPMRD